MWYNLVMNVLEQVSKKLKSNDLKSNAHLIIDVLTLLVAIATFVITLLTFLKV